MANRRRKSRPASGRTTPKRSVPPPPKPRPAPRRGFDPAQPFQVGRRPSNPLFLMLVGLLWVVAGIVALFALHAGWKFVPAIVFVGIGLFFVRSSSATVLRRDRRRDK
jgi:hypothetical protein